MFFTTESDRISCIDGHGSSTQFRPLIVFTTESDRIRCTDGHGSLTLFFVNGNTRIIMLTLRLQIISSLTYLLKYITQISREKENNNNYSS